MVIVKNKIILLPGNKIKILLPGDKKMCIRDRGYREGERERERERL